MVEKILIRMSRKIPIRLKQEDPLQGSLRSEILDQGDAVEAWQSPGLAAVLFPTSESLNKVTHLTWDPVSPHMGPCVPSRQLEDCQGRSLYPGGML
jgi:hypothetical protein